MLGVNDVIRRGGSGGKCPLQPRQRRHGLGVAVAQPLKQLHAERIAKGLALEGPQHGDVGRRPRRLIRQPVIGETVRPFALQQPRHDAARHAAQVFDQQHPQRDGNGPQLADGQRLNALIGAAEPHHRIEFDAVVGVRDDGPRQAIDARIAAQGPVGELRQLFVISGRQITPHRTDVLVHDVVIVHEPFGCRRYRVPLANSGGEGVEGGIETVRVGAQAAAQRDAGGLRRQHFLRLGETLGVVFKPFDAENLSGNRLVDLRAPIQ